MNVALREIGTLLMLFGWGFYMYGSTRYRLPHAPIAFNGPSGWPWQHHDWFAPRGVRYRKLGLVALGLAVAAYILSLLPVW